jgi:hypothetical protein
MFSWSVDIFVNIRFVYFARKYKAHECSILDTECSLAAALQLLFQMLFIVSNIEEASLDVDSKTHESCV